MLGKVEYLLGIKTKGDNIASTGTINPSKSIVKNSSTTSASDHQQHK